MSLPVIGRCASALEAHYRSANALTQFPKCGFDRRQRAQLAPFGIEGAEADAMLVACQLAGLSALSALCGARGAHATVAKNKRAVGPRFLIVNNVAIGQ
jgi:hypothetical protein